MILVIGEMWWYVLVESGCHGVTGGRCGLTCGYWGQMVC